MQIIEENNNWNSWIRAAFFSNRDKTYDIPCRKKILRKKQSKFYTCYRWSFILFRYANRLCQEFDTQWIADYRDPWTLNQEEQKNKFNLWFSSYFEKKWVSNAVLITTVSTFVQEKIQRILTTDKDYLIIPNGFDPDNIEAVKHIQQNREKLTISFGIPPR